MFFPFRVRISSCFSRFGYDGGCGLPEGGVALGGTSDERTLLQGVHSGAMQHVIQLLAALANGRARARFARIALAGEEGVAADPSADRLLRAAGVLEELPGGAVRIDEAALAALLARARAAAPARPAGKVDLLPRQRGRRLQLLQELAAAVLGEDERVAERELNARLSERVLDIPGVRRALVDEGIVAREVDGSAYWRSSAG
ncbi:DUF2087 domain-containing protein [Sinomonas atrocyanea]|uniref:DUF2087 domain-containing protein n=2 Tax=Sinomonas atrocyanea TaxID=37927 RepID=UPI00286510E4|nr:DUF2087 domain-containing protein [Sinomonas atrocyanea]MDR6623313.1 hypothetical protein [Sinomonas atrocyanea]